MVDFIHQENLEQLLSAQKLTALQKQLLGMHSSEIADFIESIPTKKRLVIWELMDTDLAGKVLSNLQEAVRADLLEQVQPTRVFEATKGLEKDDVADIIQNLPEQAQVSVLLSMDEQNRQHLSSLLSYPSNTAGGLMSTDIITIRSDVSLDVVIRYLRLLGKIPQKTDNLMVVDRYNHYLGVLALTELLVQNGRMLVNDAMLDTAELSADLPAIEVAKIFEQRDLVSAAVTDQHGKLLGRVTVDDVVDVIQDKAEQTVKNMAGLRNDDIFSPIFVSIKRRALWLGINLLTVFLGSWVIGRFEETIHQLVALAVLLPIVAGMGGIAGSQTLTIAIRAIALGQLRKSNTNILLAKELAIGFFHGIIWACVVAIVVSIWFENTLLGLVIGLAMVINLLTAALAGALIPLVLNHYGIDPAIAGSVVLTTVTDVVGFLSFLGLASLLLVS